MVKYKTLKNQQKQIVQQAIPEQQPCLLLVMHSGISRPVQINTAVIVCLLAGRE